MRILVTGGLGFVGIHLSHWLAEQIPSAHIVIGDIQTVKPEVHQFFADVQESVSFTYLDVCNRDAFRQLVNQWEIQTIIHAAAITPDDQQERQRMDWVIDVNLGGAVNAAMIAAQQATVSQLILVSSNGVYKKSPAGSTPLDEDSPQELDILYTITKHSAELLIQRSSQLANKRMASVRLSAIYGEMESVSESRNRLSHIGRLTQVLAEKRIVKVAGGDVSRDWLYAGDCAEGIRRLLLAPTWNHPVYNLGSGAVLSFREMVGVFQNRGLQAEWVDSIENAEICMHPAQTRAALDLTRLRRDTGFFVPMNPVQRLDWFLQQININRG